jgi:predicted nucleic acid-binding protein
LILYLDTSSLVKLYVEETHSTRVRQWVEKSELVATCRIAFPETVSALDRRFRSGDFTRSVYERLLSGFSGDWPHFVVTDFDEQEAGRLVRKYGLRGFDAVHLSSAGMIRGGADLTLSFSSFDEKLNHAAIAEGFIVLLPQ